MNKQTAVGNGEGEINSHSEIQKSLLEDMVFGLGFEGLERFSKRIWVRGMTCPLPSPRSKNRILICAS